MFPIGSSLMEVLQTPCMFILLYIFCLRTLTLFSKVTYKFYVSVLNLLLWGPVGLVGWAAHTEGSAIALAKTLREAFPKASLALVVAMACDKDHSAFAQALLKGNIIITGLITCHVTAGV